MAHRSIGFLSPILEKSLIDVTLFIFLKHTDAPLKLYNNLNMDQLMGTHVQLDDVFCFTNFLSRFLFRVRGRVRVRARGGFRVRVRVRTSVGG